MLKRRLPALDLCLVRGSHLRLVMHEQKRREVIIDAGALQALTGSEKTLFRQRGAAKLFMMRGAIRPGCAPVIVTFELAGDLLEIGEYHAIGDEARTPMRDRGLEQR